jgi:poly-gamma-glutamate synthesis protein (capsule biosynthesis protein)
MTVASFGGVTNVLGKARDSRIGSFAKFTARTALLAGAITILSVQPLRAAPMQTPDADFTVASMGDLLYTAPQAETDDPALKPVIALIRSADVAIANQEGEAFDLKSFKGHPYGLGQVYGHPTLAKDYRGLGIDMVTMANNHSTDWGRQGLRDSAALLDEAGIVHAGSGDSLTEARGPAILKSQNGRVALVAAASTFKANASALDSLGEVPGRAGISVLRTRTVHLVTAADMAKVRALATDLASPLNPAPPADSRQVEFGGEIYRLSDRPGLQYDMNVFDHDSIVGAIRDARKKADVVVFGIHAHETSTGVDDDTPEPPDFLIKLFHDVVDAGADVVMGGGPHSLRGIEIYKGKPIFYGLGLFFFKPSVMGSQEAVTNRYPPMPYPEMPDPRPSNPSSWYDSVLAVTSLHDGKMREVRLYPIDLRHEAAGFRGLPHLAAPQKAQEILRRLQQESAQFGTRIEVDGSVGVIRP